jgi:hypothetical protein
MESADDSSIFWGKGLLSAAENKNDFYLRDMAPAETSLVYHGSGRPVVYDYDLHIHLTQLDSNRTRIEIVTINLRFFSALGFRTTFYRLNHQMRESLRKSHLRPLKNIVFCS